MKKNIFSQIEFGSWQCAGAGEIYCPVYANGRFLCDIWDNNGMSPEFPDSGLSSKELLIRKYGSIEALERAVEELGGPQECRCEYCGEVIYVRNEKYEAEWPSSSEMYYAQLREEHEENCLYMEEEEESGED